MSICVTSRVCTSSDKGDLEVRDERHRVEERI